jgi:Flp pilus assembly protein TadD
MAISREMPEDHPVARGWLAGNPVHFDSVRIESIEDAGFHGEESAMASRKERLEQMLQEDPNDPFLRYGLAMEHVAAGDDAAAVEIFRGLIEVAADYVPAYMQMGQALARLGRDQEAQAAWQQGIEQARRQGNDHAAAEMQGMIDSLQ